MSVFQNIQDFLQVPSHLNHDQLYRENLSRNIVKTKNDVDMVQFELSTMGTLEKNILTGMNMPTKFRYKDMHKELQLSIGAMLKGGEPWAQTNLKHVDKKKFTYLVDHPITVRPKNTSYVCSDTPGIVGTRDSVIRRELNAACINMSAQSYSDISMTIAGEKRTFVCDMRYMMMKGYLYLMDYNLAVVSGVKERMESTLTPNVKSNITPQGKMAAMCNYSVVVDSDLLTPQETRLLMMLDAQYPCVKYADNNIYNSISMESSDVCFLSDGIVKYMDGFDFGDPDTMYFTLINLACKLGCLEDLRRVIRDMRGLPAFMHKVSSRTNQTCMNSVYPPSLNIKLSTGVKNIWTDYVSKHSNYLTTSKGLIVDLIMAEASEMSFINGLHAIGAISLVSNETLTVRDESLQSMLRLEGYSDDNIEYNQAKVNLMQVREVDLCVDMTPSIKPYALSLVDGMLNNNLECTPQINFEIPFMIGENTPWSALRGAGIQGGYPLPLDEEVAKDATTLCMLWCLGKTKRTPKIGFNLIGEHDLQIFTQEEYEFLQFARGEYRMANVSYTLGKEVVGRKDGLEVTALSMHRSLYGGTRTLAVINNNGVVVFDCVQPKEDLTFNETFGFKNSEDEEYDRQEESGEVEIIPLVTPGGSRVKKETGKTSVIVPEKIKPKVGGISQMEYQRLMSKVKSMNLKAFPDRGYDVGDTIKPDTQETSGQNMQCGFRAVAQDLVNHNLLPRDKVDEFVTEWVQRTGVRENVEVNVLARALNEVGMGLRVVAVDEHGQCTVHNFGTKESKHNVNLLNKLNHYENIIDYTHGDQSIRVVGVNGDLNPSESMRQLDEMCHVARQM